MREQFLREGDYDWNEKIHNYYELTVDLTYFFVSCFGEAWLTKMLLCAMFTMKKRSTQRNG